MKLSRPYLALWLSLALPLLAAAVFFAQGRPPKTGPPPPVRRARPVISLNTELAAAINELLKEEPLAPPESNAATDNAKHLKDGALAPPPADDAPLAELLAFWQQQQVVPDGLHPSEKAAQRLLEAVEARPWLMERLLDKLPLGEETAERLYRLYQQAPDDDDRWKSGLHQWLRFNSRYFVDELLEAAKQEGAEPGADPFALDALARLDWEKAKPLLLAQSENPFAIVALYKGAARNNEVALADQIRAQLREMVAEREAGEMRMFALQALAESEWNGQAEWLAGLFADTSLTGIDPERLRRRLPEMRAPKDAAESWDQLHEPGNNLLAQLLQSQRKKLLPIVQKLIGNPDRNVHNAAVDTLTQFLFAYRQAGEQDAAEAARSLLPWLGNPAWADGPQREALIGALPDLKLPESASGMLYVLENDEDEALRALAAETLGNLKFTAAAPAIRRALEREKNEELRQRLVTALMFCGGISDEEAAAAIEAFARKMAAPNGQAQLEALRNNEDVAPLPLQLSVGRILSDSETIPCSEGLAARLFARVKALRKTQPNVAKQILNIVQGAPLPQAYQFLAERLGEGWLDVEALKLALEHAAELRQHASGELFPLITQGVHAAGIAAVLLKDTALQTAVLQGKDAKAQLALLATARYLRTALPVDLVAPLLADKTLGMAAESYLIVEDSVPARQLVWARHPGEALLLGANRPLDMSMEQADPPAFKRREEVAQHIVKAGEAEEVYALYSPGDLLKAEIRVRKDRAQLRLFTDPNVWRMRDLSNSELIELQTLAARPEVAELKPEAPLGGYREGFAEFVRVSKDGGYRVVLEGLKPAPRDATLHEQLSELFYRFSKAGEYKTHYSIEAKLPGVEVLFAAEPQQVFAVCQEGGETLVLAGEQFDQKHGLLNAELAWHLFKDGRLGSAVNAPAIFNELNLSEYAKVLMRLRLMNARQAISGPVSVDDVRQLEIRPNPQGMAGGIPAAAESLPTGNGYLEALSTPNHQWTVGLKFDPKRGTRLLRINTQTGQEFEVAPDGQLLLPLAYVAGPGKMLLSGGLDYRRGQRRFYLLNPENGEVQTVEGEFRPLQDQSLRPLQPTGKANEFWAVLSDAKGSRVGRYDERAFTFTPVLEVPGLSLRSADVWVDEARGKVWLTYKGHLLRLPLPAPGK
ncbi:MAG: HEAT repeat domain-containing protein [Acidobacteria bacterium]|nr:HEAT repeat domain-containing protein [Acidobacteriota bacterium]MBI3425007.1 HEAT repeat domain-containing protein [Acidobacteriota bacterium]